MTTEQNVHEEIAEYLHSSAPAMQLATVAHGKPWIASVYFVADDDLNIYWLSWPERRHSRELTKCANVAAIIVVKTDQPVIGVQIAGTATLVEDAQEVAAAISLYQQKYGLAEDFMRRFTAGAHRHNVYKLRPSEIQLFDEQTFPLDSPFRIEV